MKQPSRLARCVALSCMLTGVPALTGCNGFIGRTSPDASPTPIASDSIALRVVEGSPDAGPVDVYVYDAGTTLPFSPTFQAAVYPSISDYTDVPVGSGNETIAVYRANATTNPIASQNVTITSGEQLSVVVAGTVAQASLQLQTFIEPAEPVGTTALLVHHASPGLNALVNPLGFAVYAVGNGVPLPSATTQLFSFSLAPAGNGPSGPAKSGTVAGGQYYIAPSPSTLPTKLGFAVGKPGTGGQLASIATASQLSNLAGALNATTGVLTQGEQNLLSDTADTLAPGDHLSVFVVDGVTSNSGVLIGTFDS